MGYYCLIRQEVFYFIITREDKEIPEEQYLKIFVDAPYENPLPQEAWEDKNNDCKYSLTITEKQVTGEEDIQYVTSKKKIQYKRYNPRTKEAFEALIKSQEHDVWYKKAFNKTFQQLPENPFSELPPEGISKSPRKDDSRYFTVVITPLPKSTNLPENSGSKVDLKQKHKAKTLLKGSNPNNPNNPNNPKKPKSPTVISEPTKELITHSSDQSKKIKKNRSKTRSSDRSKEVKLAIFVGLLILTALLLILTILTAGAAAGVMLPGALGFLGAISTVTGLSLASLSTSTAFASLVSIALGSMLLGTGSCLSAIRVSSLRKNENFLPLYYEELCENVDIKDENKSILESRASEFELFKDSHSGKKSLAENAKENIRNFAGRAYLSTSHVMGNSPNKIAHESPTDDKTSCCILFF